MPPLPMAATSLVPSAEDATAFHCLLGALVQAVQTKADSRLADTVKTVSTRAIRSGLLLVENMVTSLRFTVSEQSGGSMARKHRRRSSAAVASRLRDALPC